MSHPFRRYGLLAAGLLLSGLTAPARATEPFAYRWQTPRVRIRWTEGGGTSRDPGLRRQVGHWKRVAQTLWKEKPAAPPLEMDVSFFGPELGSSGPAVRLRCGARGQTVGEPITEARVAAALYQVRDGAAPSSPVLPSDDSEARLSPNGQWTSTISWRGSGPEVWLAQRDTHNVVRVSYPGSERLVDRVILTRPEWTAGGQILSWIQGGRVVVYDVPRHIARLASPRGKQAVQVFWSPHPASPGIVRYEDGSVDLLDLSREAAVPVSDLLRDSAATGGFYWSPSGDRVLFPAQGRIVSRDLASPAGAFSAVQRGIERLLGLPSGPPTRMGESENRLAVLNIAEHRLDTFSVKGTPLDLSPPRGVAWARSEDLVFAAAGPAGGSEAEGEGEAEGGGSSAGAWSLVRFPLRAGPSPSVVFQSPEPIACVGEPTDPVPASQLKPSAPPRLEFLRGERVVIVEDGTPPRQSEPYTAAQLIAYHLPPGPEGGYLGVEADTITSNERGEWTLFAPLLSGQGAGVRFLAPGGVFATTALDPQLRKRLEEGIREGRLVGLDLYPGTRHSVFGLTESDGGGAAKVDVLTPGLDAPDQVHVDSLSERLAQEQADVVGPLDQPFHVVDAHTGLERMSNGYQTATIMRLILTGLLLALAIGGMIGLRQKLRKA